MLLQTPTWTYRALYLGRSIFELRVYGVLLSLEVSDGGGRVPTIAIWRIGRRTVAIIEAGPA